MKQRAMTIICMSKFQDARKESQLSYHFIEHKIQIRCSIERKTLSKKCVQLCNIFFWEKPFDLPTESNTH